LRILNLLRSRHALPAREESSTEEHLESSSLEVGRREAEFRPQEVKLVCTIHPARAPSKQQNGKAAGIVNISGRQRR
jgi:hypothetical protein